MPTHKTVRQNDCQTVYRHQRFYYYAAALFYVQSPSYALCIVVCKLFCLLTIPCPACQEVFFILEREICLPTLAFVSRTSQYAFFLAHHNPPPKPFRRTPLAYRLIESVLIGPGRARLACDPSGHLHPWRDRERLLTRSSYFSWIGQRVPAVVRGGSSLLEPTKSPNKSMLFLQCVPCCNYFLGIFFHPCMNVEKMSMLIPGPALFSSSFYVRQQLKCHLARGGICPGSEQSVPPQDNGPMSAPSTPSPSTCQGRLPPLIPRRTTSSLNIAPGERYLFGFFSLNGKKSEAFLSV